MKRDFTAIVLAAGKGKRMRSRHPKVLHRLAGKPLIYYVLRELMGMRRYIKQIVVVVGHKNKNVEEAARKYFSHSRKKLDFVYQNQPLGTADAVRCAQQKVKCDDILIMCADTPLITRTTLRSFISFFLRKRAACALITAYRSDKNDLGSVLRDSKGRPCAVKEKLDFNPQGILAEVNSGIYCFKRDALLQSIKKIEKNARKQEYFLTDAIQILSGAGCRIEAYLLDDSEQILGINTQHHLRRAEKALRRKICDQFIARGVNIIDPESTFIEEGAKIGKNTYIYPFTFIEKNVIIGSNCTLGPFIHVREGCRIKDNAYLGNFVEICRSKIGKGVRMKHLGYLGDTSVGDNVNIGAGTVVANFDGKKKHKTFIEEDSFIGCDTILIAPLKVGKGAFTGAGSVVTRDVGAYTVVAGVPARILKSAQKYTSKTKR
ncbi:MAG: bifunctional N-acetylglucosamine-1-phosphate uridyltransferase/glucosamine-1-phosphate acetyltransferase [Candidatus Omnitrophota bacterium]|nr:MAG: bifunctional N-acetylglucosamine-1-phosphate uridyltransferase/glucosamine-1-phosphate acetyltransferase [Candidatus Omnitrophota bacterium]